MSAVATSCYGCRVFYIYNLYIITFNKVVNTIIQSLVMQWILAVHYKCFDLNHTDNILGFLFLMRFSKFL